MRSDLTDCRVVGEGLCAEKRVKGNAAKSKLNLCCHQMMNNLNASSDILHSQIYQFCVMQDILMVQRAVKQRKERDAGGGGLVLQKEQGHCILFFPSLTHFLLHTHIIALIIQWH